MPLRDHFHAPLDDIMSWEGIHGQWPAMLVLTLARTLPPGFIAIPTVHHGAFEIDVATYEKNEAVQSGSGRGGAVATAWAPARPTRTVETDLPDTDEYEVRVFDVQRGRRLVAAIEIVSPANKDRPERQRAFIGKCAALLQNQVSVAIIDLVTSRGGNLFASLLEFLGQPISSPAADSSLYAVACRYVQPGQKWLFKTWEYVLTLGQPLPTLPLWLSDELAIPLELEATYEETCRVFRLT